MIPNESIPVSIDCPAPAIRTRGLVKRYRRTDALSGLDLTVPEGAFYLLVGPNGAGKSTTLRLLLDLARPDVGSIRVLGRDPAAGPQVRAMTGYVPEGHEELYRWMRVDEALDFHANYFTAWDDGYAAGLTRDFGLDPTARLGSLSKGQRRRVQLIMALAHRPSLLLLDEPTDGLDPPGHELFLELLAEHLADDPVTVLVSTHQVHEVDRLADHIGVLRDGRLGAEVARSDLHRGLRSYELELPEGWSVEAEGFGGSVLRRLGRGREQRWQIWGDEHAVASGLQSSGFVVRSVGPVTLTDAAIALLSPEEGAQGNPYARTSTGGKG